MGCTHSVIYYCSPLLWQESARDHADGLLSFAHPPSVYISDVAGRVARHTNNRTEQKFFQPYDGRLCEPSPNNIQLAQQKTLKVDLPWVQNMSFKRNVMEHEEREEPEGRLQQAHPITGSKERYSLYDRFHQKNQTRPEEILRSLDNVPELRSIINSSAGEQMNRELSYDRYFLCQMKDKHFMFALRLIFHLHNNIINQKFMEDMKKHSTDTLEISHSGRLAFLGAGNCISYDQSLIFYFCIVMIGNLISTCP